MQLELQDVRRALLGRGPLSDQDFDVIYPLGIRRASRRFWTPLETASRAALLLADAGARLVLDVGSGVGKFALVAAATAPHLHIVGIEQRAQLVQVARTARTRLALENATFMHGNATDFDPSDWLDSHAELSPACFARDVVRTVNALRAAPRGMAIVTFHGSSARIPRSFELHHQEASGSGWLRLWIKHRVHDDGSFFVEDGETLVAHDTSGQQI